MSDEQRRIVQEERKRALELFKIAAVRGEADRAAVWATVANAMQDILDGATELVEVAS